MKRVLPLLLALLVAALAAGGYFAIRARQNSRSNSAATDRALPDTSAAPAPDTDQTQDGTGQKTSSGVVLTLTINSPANGATVTSPSVTVKGQTAPNAEVFINDTETIADTSGKFSAVIVLEEGENYILVSANDADGNFKEQELSITYNSGD